MLPRNVRNAIRRPGITIQRLISKLGRLRGKTIEVQVLPDWKVSCHPICWTEFSVFSTDAEQELELQCFARQASPGMQFMDVGTHWGVFTLAALHYGGLDARVVGIEASDEAVKIYRDNLTINHVQDRVVVVNAACGASEGYIKMLTTGAGGADYFVVPAEERADTVVVPQVSVDSVVEAHGFQPTHMKIDVEGFEEEVLRGAVKTMQTLRPFLFLELHGPLIRQRGFSPQTVLDQLTACGYTRWQHLDGSMLTLSDLEKVNFSARFTASHADPEFKAFK